MIIGGWGCWILRRLRNCLDQTTIAMIVRIEGLILYCFFIVKCYILREGYGRNNYL
jgi:hypothetical protein